MRQNNTEKKDDRQKDPQDMSMEFNMMQVKNDEVEQKDSKMDLQELELNDKNALDDKVDRFLKGLADQDDKNVDDGPGFYDEPDYEQFGADINIDDDDDDEVERKVTTDVMRMNDEHEGQITGHIKVQTRVLHGETPPSLNLHN